MNTPIYQILIFLFDFDAHSLSAPMLKTRWLSYLAPSCHQLIHDWKMVYYVKSQWGAQTLTNKLKHCRIDIKLAVIAVCTPNLSSNPGRSRFWTEHLQNRALDIACLASLIWNCLPLIEKLSSYWYLKQQDYHASKRVSSVMSSIYSAHSWRKRTNDIVTALDLWVGRKTRKIREIKNNKKWTSICCLQYYWMSRNAKHPQYFSIFKKPQQARHALAVWKTDSLYHVPLSSSSTASLS